MISLKEKSIGKNKNDISKKEKLGRHFELWKPTLEVKVVVLRNVVPCCEFCSLNTLVLSEREKVKSQILCYKSFFHQTDLWFKQLERWGIPEWAIVERTLQSGGICFQIITLCQHFHTLFMFHPFLPTPQVYRCQMCWSPPLLKADFSRRAGVSPSFLIK